MSTHEAEYSFAETHVAVSLRGGPWDGATLFVGYAQEMPKTLWVRFKGWSGAYKIYQSNRDLAYLWSG